LIFLSTQKIPKYFFLLNIKKIIVTKLKLFFWRPDGKNHLCSGGFPFSGKVFPYLKNGQNKCPFSFLATDFRKKICHLFEENFFDPFFQDFLTLCK